MPISERDWWRHSAALLYDEHEFEEPRPESGLKTGPTRPSIAWTIWQLVVLVFLGAVILGLLASLFR